jgi:hypothetical protein
MKKQECKMKKLPAAGSALIWRQRSARSADFQSAVSPNCIRQGAENPAVATVSKPLRIENPRYGRLKICATIKTCLCQIKALPIRSRLAIFQSSFYILPLKSYV